MYSLFAKDTLTYTFLVSGQPVLTSEPLNSVLMGSSFIIMYISLLIEQVCIERWWTSGLVAENNRHQAGRSLVQGHGLT